MRNRKVIVAGAVIMLVGTLALFWLSRLGSRRGRITVSFVTYATNSTGGRVATFRLANERNATFVCPADCTTEIRETSQKAQAICPEIKVRPGETNMFTLAVPATPGVWRLGLSHYFLDLPNRLKIRLELSPLGSHIPSRWLGVRGEVIWSDWVE